MPYHNEERERLNRRIYIADRELAYELKHYRKRISKARAVEERGADMVYVPRGDSGFLEGSDVVDLCHQFLDKHGVPEHPVVNERRS